MSLYKNSMHLLPFRITNFIHGKILLHYQICFLQVIHKEVKQVQACRITNRIPSFFTSYEHLGRDRSITNNKWKEQLRKSLTIDLRFFIKSYPVRESGQRNSWRVDVRRRELRVIMPWSTTGCWGMLTSITPMDTSAELCSLPRRISVVSMACDLLMFIVTTVL